MKGLFEVFLLFLFVFSLFGFSFVLGEETKFSLISPTGQFLDYSSFSCTPALINSIDSITNDSGTIGLRCNNSNYDDCSLVISKNYSTEGVWYFRHVSNLVLDTGCSQEIYTVNWDLSRESCLGYGKNWLDYDGGLCCGDDLGESLVTYYRDYDNDGYGNLSNSILGCNSFVPSGYVLDNLDCNDNSFNSYPGNFETGFLFCNDGVDNNCNYEIDSVDTGCQVSCGVGFSELFRFSSISSNSIVGVANDFDYYFPLCLKYADGSNNKIVANIQNSCPDSFISVLKYNPTTKLVSVLNQSGNGYTQNICINSVDCNVKESCDEGFSALMSLTSLKDSHVSHPSIDLGYKLCCAVESVGISFDYYGFDTNKDYLCNYISDGICPEDFEDEFGNRVSCEKYHDPDCGWSSNVVGETKWRKLLKFNFYDKVYVLAANNSNGSLVQIYNESLDKVNNIYSYEFSITSDIHSVTSQTQIQFSYGTKKPEIFFDSEVIESCDGNGGVNPCYIWDSSNYLLIVNHSLSSHMVKVDFYYSDFSVILICIILFAILIPVFLILFSKKKTHLKIRFKLFDWFKFKKFNNKTQNDLNDLINYVEKRILLGHSHANIKSDLLHVGWKKHIINLALNGLHKKENRGKLEGYILACLDDGVKKSDIYGTLISIGWDRGEVDEIFSRI